MKGYRRIERTARSLSEYGARQLTRCLVPRGVGVSCIGWQMGKAVRIDEPTVTNQQINSIVISADSIADLGFVYYSLSARQTEIFNLGSGGSRTPILKKSSFEDLPFLLPPISEQRAIAHILGALDDKIELNRRTNQTLEEIARTLFKSWFVDFDPVRAKAEGRPPEGMDAETAALFPDAFEESELGPIPKGWMPSTVGDEFDLVMGQSPPGSTYNEIGDGLPFYQGRRDFGSRFPARRVYCSEPRRLAEPGDTLVTVRAPVGSLNIASEECCIGRGVAAIRHQSRGTSYTFYSADSLGPQFEPFESQGTVFGALNKNSFGSLKILRPPAPLVASFDAATKPLDRQYQTLDEEASTLANLRDTLLPKLLSGDLRIDDPDKFLEENVP